MDTDVRSGKQSHFGCQLNRSIEITITFVWWHDADNQMTARNSDDYVHIGIRRNWHERESRFLRQSTIQLQAELRESTGIERGN